MALYTPNKPFLAEDLAGIMHLSGCAIVEHGEILLLYSRERRHFELPGGKVQPGETLEQAATREAREEIGVEAILERFAGVSDHNLGDQVIRSFRFMARLPPGQQPILLEPKKFSEISKIPILKHDIYPLAPNVRVFCKEYLDGKYGI